MNSGLGPVSEFMIYELCECLRFCFSFFQALFLHSPLLGFSPASLTAEAPVRDKGFGLQEERVVLRHSKTLSASETSTGPAGGDPAKPVGEQPVVLQFKSGGAGLGNLAALT